MLDEWREEGACVENMGSERSSIWLGKCAEWYGRLYDSGSRFGEYQLKIRKRKSNPIEKIHRKGS